MGFRTALVASVSMCAIMPFEVLAQEPISEPGAPVEALNNGNTGATQQGSSIALDAEPADVGEIIVTAQRRTERAQDVPISLTALSEDALAEASVDNVLDIPLIAPGFNATRASQAANTRLAVRGIGTSGNSSIEPSVGAFVDGIYIPRPGPLLATLNDIESVEVLRGPQGTLFGRNATAGAIVFNTNDPDPFFAAQLFGEYGSYDRVRLGTIINVPVHADIAVRASAIYDSFDGYGFNVLTNGRYGDSETVSFRVGLSAALTSTLNWTIKADYQAQRGDGQTPTSVVADSVTPSARQNFITRTNGNIPILDETYTFRNRSVTEGTLNDDQWGLASDLSLDIGLFTLRLLSGYRDWDYKQSEDDITNTPNAFYGRDASFRSLSHSQELQLISPDNVLLDGRLSFVTGLYYFRERYEIGEQVNLGSDFCPLIIARAAPTLVAPCNAGPLQGATDFNFDQVTRSLAAYGQATYSLTDTIDLTGGLRYSHDSKDGDLISILNNRAAIVRAADTVPGLEFDDGQFTYRANVSYRPQRGLMFYATYSTGYKSGGFDAGNGGRLGLNRFFDPETTTNYELGAKTELFNRVLTANATLFRMDVDDFQLRSFNGQTFSIRNAGSLRQQGLEFDVIARPMEGLSFGISAIRLDSEYTEFTGAPNLPGLGGTQDLTGERANYSPKWQGVLSGSYESDLPSGNLAISIAGNLSFQSESDISGAGDNNPQALEPAYQVLGGRISLYDIDEDWEVFVSGSNITDTRFCTIRFSQVLNGPLGVSDTMNGGSIQRCVLGQPREIRVGAKVRF